MCSIEAAARYHIPVDILLAVATLEGGSPATRRRNTDGSVDIGTLQFNTTYLRSLARYGITAEHVAVPGCYPFHLAAWRLRKHLLHDQGDAWTRAANFHSRTPRFNQQYRAKLIASAGAWSAWLKQQGAITGPAQTGQDKSPPASYSPGAYVGRTITAAVR
jgi:hypothetical protein